MKNEMITLNEFELKRVQEDFLTFLDIDILSLRAYKTGIENFINYLKTNNIKQPTRLDFRSYRESLREVKSSNTINSYLTSVRALFKYLSANNIYEDITTNIKNVKTASVPKCQVLDKEIIQKLYNNAHDKRERALIGLFITTGLRANEVAMAKIENIKVYNGEVVLFVKCKKRDDESEYVKLSPRVLEDIKSYIEHRTNGYIFVSTSNNNNGEGMTSKSIRQIVKKILKDNNIDEDYISCHTLRRSFATISYESGADLREIKDVLHQRSISTTQRYINQSVRDNNKLEHRISSLIFDN